MPKIVCFCLVMLLTATCSCATREVVDKFKGSTAQRLTTYSIDRSIQKLPEKDFSLLKNKKVYFECHFIEEIKAMDYLEKRLEMELMDKYGCELTSDESDAQMSLQVFVNSLSAEKDKAGFQTPDLVLPGVGGLSSIDIITYDMYHGITELYY